MHSFLSRASSQEYGLLVIFRSCGIHVQQAHWAYTQKHIPLMLRAWSLFQPPVRATPKIEQKGQGQKIVFSG